MNKRQAKKNRAKIQKFEAYLCTSYKEIRKINRFFIELRVDQKRYERNINKCIKKVKKYIETHNFDWTIKELGEHYKKYYLNGWYCSDSFMKIIKNNKRECELVWGR